MSDDQGKGGGQASESPDDLEVKPDWGGAAEADKPRQVAVRKEGDVAEAMKPSAADAVYVEETASVSEKIRRERNIGFTLLALVLLGFVGFVAWNILRVEVTLDAETMTVTRVRQVVVKTKVTSTHDVQVRVEGHGDAKAIEPGKSELTFPISMDGLKLGDNLLKVQVVRGGEVLKEVEVHGFRDFDLEVDKGKVANAPHPVYLNFKMAAGWKVRVNGKDYEPDSKGLAQVRVSMKQVFSALDRFTEPTYKLEVPSTIIRPDGDNVFHGEKIDVMLPQSRLELEVQGDAVVTAEKKATINGKTDPGGKVWVNQEEVPVDEEGNFSASVKLPKNKKLDIKSAKDVAAALTVIRTAAEEGRALLVPVMARVPSKVPSTRELLAIKVKAKIAKKYAKLAAAAN